MGVKTVLAGAAAGEVLGGHRNAVRRHTMVAALDAGDDVLHDLADERRVLAKGAVGALPAGIGDGVGHVHVALAQAAGVPFAADGLGKLVHNVNAVALDGGRNAQRAGIGGKDAARIVHAKHQLAVLVAGVGGRRHGDKVLALLTDGVGLVHPVGQIGGGGVGAQNDMAVEPLLQQGGGAGQILLAKNGLAAELALVQNAGFIGDLLLGGHGGCGAAGRVLGHAPVRDEQLGNLLPDRQLLHIGGGAVGGGQTPVVDGVDLPGAVNVLEGQAVLLDHPAVDGGDHRSALVAVNLDVVRCFCHKEPLSHISAARRRRSNHLHNPIVRAHLFSGVRPQWEDRKTRNQLLPL